MTMSRLLNVMRAQGAMANQGVLSIRIGIVSGYDPAQYAVKVTFPPDATETAFIPYCTPWMGNQWGIYAPPAIGQAVAVAFQEGGQDAGFAFATYFDTVAPPLTVNPGELWIVHANGQSVKLTNDGKLTLADGHGAQVQMDGAGNIASQGNWTHTGNLTVQSGTTAVAAITSNGHDISSTHKHTGVQPGSGISGTPQ